MSARILDGVAVGQAIRADVRPMVDAFTRDAGRPPGLALVLVGNDPASELYVGSKLKSAGESGLRADIERLPASASLDELLALVERLNRSEALRRRSSCSRRCRRSMGADAERHVFDAIAPDKDVDGFHPINVGRLVQGRAELVACTPSGVIELLDRSGIQIAGARAVVIGRSDIVGKPMALLLLHRHATVTICHSRTRDLPAVAREADILVAALGRAGICHAGFRQARRDGHRRRNHARRGPSARRALVSGGIEAARPPSSGAALWSSATCIPTSRRSPAR